MADEEGMFPLPAPVPLADNVCDVCGMELKNSHGVSMHKSIAHNDSPNKRKHGRPKGSKNRPRPAPAPKRELSMVLRERWSDKNGRILLTDQDGNWWVARKLDV